MKSIFFVCLLGVAFAAPDYGQQASAHSREDFAKIVRDDRVNPEGGKYSFSVETEDGIHRSESGSPLDVEGNPTGQQGVISFTFPNGEEFNLKFVANENGYHPESSWLPVAPEFPHPIPQFVLDQIEFAAREDAESARSSQAPRRTYGYEDSDEK